VAGEEVRILVVCSANQCRSPLAAASLRAHAEVRELPVVVTSVGTQALPGVPATDPTVQAGRKLGLDLTLHASTRVEPAAVADADLVVAMERRHVQELVVLAPGTFGRTFTLRELARRGDAVGARRPGESTAAWLARVAKGRRPADMLGASAIDDIADPTGSRASDHLSTAEEIDKLAAHALELLFPR
jgi:protein-tyrosine phosphatase